MPPPTPAQPRRNTLASEVSSRFNLIVTHAATAALAAFVAWILSSYWKYEGYVAEQQKAKVELFNLIRKKQAPLALALISYYKDKYGSSDHDYRDLLQEVEKLDKFYTVIHIRLSGYTSNRFPENE